MGVGCFKKFTPTCRDLPSGVEFDASAAGIDGAARNQQIQAVDEAFGVLSERFAAEILGKVPGDASE